MLLEVEVVRVLRVLLLEMEVLRVLCVLLLEMEVLRVLRVLLLEVEEELGRPSGLILVGQRVLWLW